MTSGLVQSNRLVVDACVAIKWFVEEEEAENARCLLTAARQLVAPDVLVSELGSALLKKVRSGEMLPEDVPSAVMQTSLVIDFVPALSLAAGAFEIAHKFNRSFYDCLYVALAIQEDARVVTSDYKLINGLGKPFEETFVYLRDI